MRVAYKLPGGVWAVAVEEYADYGPLHHLAASGDQSHQIYGVVDHDTKSLEIEAGVGVGLNHSTDRLTLKLILSKDLNHK